MADTKISALPAVTLATATQEYAVNDSGTSRKASGAQVQTFLGMVKKRLASDDTSSATAAHKVTGFDQAVGIGTWHFKYLVRWQTSVLGTGVKFDVNFSGTQTSFLANHSWGSKSTNTGDVLKASQGTTAAYDGNAATRAPGTTGITTLTEADAANSDLLYLIEGLIVVTVAGDLQLYFGSEATGSTQTVKADSILMLTQIDG